MNGWMEDELPCLTSTSEIILIENYRPTLRQTHKQTHTHAHTADRLHCTAKAVNNHWFPTAKLRANDTDQFGEFCPVFDEVVTHVQHLNTTRMHHVHDHWRVQGSATGEQKGNIGDSISQQRPEAQPR